MHGVRVIFHQIKKMDLQNIDNYMGITILSGFGIVFIIILKT